MKDGGGEHISKGRGYRKKGVDVGAGKKAPAFFSENASPEFDKESGGFEWTKERGGEAKTRKIARGARYYCP